MLKHWIFITLTLLFTCQCQKESSRIQKPYQAGSPQKAVAQNALRHYLENEDASFEWNVEQSFTLNECKVVQLRLTSQTWRDIVWQHSLTIILPQQIDYKGALFFISGGRNNSKEHFHPDSEDRVLHSLADIAQSDQAIVALLRQVPNQPLFDGLKEDALISFTLHKFREEKGYSWPLLFPMVKSVVKGMDAVQAFTKEKRGQAVDSFLLTGYSKRGWTTWLTGANDDRVAAIAPAVIDVLNMPLNVEYQLQTWGSYSREIQDYVRLGIAQSINDSLGQELVTMIDPFSYRDQLELPKLILLGTNDPYWPVDAAKNYIHDIPGQTYVHYVPNAGHDLNDGKEVTPLLKEFLGIMLAQSAYPQFTEEFEQTSEGARVAFSSEQPVTYIEEWTAYSTDRDFRDEVWSAAKFKMKAPYTFYDTTMSYPDEGFKATYWNLVYEGEHADWFPLSTRMVVAGKDSLYLNPME